MLIGPLTVNQGLDVILKSSQIRPEAAATVEAP